MNNNVSDGLLCFCQVKPAVVKSSFVPSQMFLMGEDSSSREKAQHHWISNELEECELCARLYLCHIRRPVWRWRRLHWPPWRLPSPYRWCSLSVRTQYCISANRRTARDSGKRTQPDGRHTAAKLLFAWEENKHQLINAECWSTMTALSIPIALIYHYVKGCTFFKTLLCQTEKCHTTRVLQQNTTPSKSRDKLNNMEAAATHTVASQWCLGKRQPWLY